VWIAPGLAVFIDAAVRARTALSRVAWYGLAAVVLVLFGAWPDFWSRTAGLLQGGLINYAPSSSFAYGDNPAFSEYHWHGLQLLAGNVDLLAGLGLFVLLVATAIRLRPSWRRLR
jgi:hypothetical protein